MNESKVTVQSYIKGLIDLAIKLIVKPVDFFQTMPKIGGLIEPLLYVVITSMLGVVLMAVESSVTRGAGMHDLGMLAIGLIIVPLITVILSFFVAGICFAIWTFTGSKENYETSYRCLAYPQILFPISILLSIVPYLGLLGIAWWLYLMVIATKEVHKIPIQPALLVFGIIAASSGLVYYSSVSSEMKSKEHLQEFTKELQKMPGMSDTGNPGKR
jgi:hypothetical protein